ncbi:MAG: uracil-DNA glycosylase [Bacteroidota bacterium]|nr:uracil-DNA glycosylase [Bacteroidota bacterium]
MTEIKPVIDSSWLEVLNGDFLSPYFIGIKETLIAEISSGIKIFPPTPQIFNALNLTPFHQVKLVILGQDPYHGFGQAHGLSFSVPDNIKPPPSLNNIFKERFIDLQIPSTNNGNLSNWARQGVLLLNSILTVREGQASSHKNIGWEYFTDSIIKKLSDRRENLVFVLWGKFAQSKTIFIDSKKHLIIQSAHPSPLSAHNGFFGSRPFSLANKYLIKNQITSINWE